MPAPDPPVVTEPRYVTAQVVADRLGFNRRTVLRLAGEGKLPAVRFGKLYRFDLAAITSMFDAAGDATARE